MVAARNIRDRILKKQLQDLFGTCLNANATTGAGFRIDHRHIVFHVDSVERARGFTVTVTDAREIALIGTAKRYRSSLATVKPNVRMLLLDFAVVSSASEERNHAARRTRRLAGDRSDLFRNILLPGGTLVWWTTWISGTSFCIRFAPGESASASISSGQTGPYGLDLGIDLHGEPLGQQGQSRACETAKCGKEGYSP